MRCCRGVNKCKSGSGFTLKIQLELYLLFVAEYLINKEIYANKQMLEVQYIKRIKQM